MSADEQAAWDEATSQLGFHARPGHDWLDTLNRLWRKNRFVMSMDGVLKLAGPPPVLTREMLTVTREQWPLERLAPLVHVDAHDRARPKRDERPILVLEWERRHYLIDGINRINRRVRDRQAGPHAVIVIHGLVHPGVAQDARGLARGARRLELSDNRRPRNRGRPMSYQLQIIEKPNYLHAIVTGSNTLENVTGYLQDLVRECEARQTFNVLIEERLTGRRLETWDVYQIASDHSVLARGVFRAIAYVDVNAGGELMKFAETVANNRGVPMNLFATVAEAEAWLAGKSR